jgi:hypothetical protein
LPVCQPSDAFGVKAQHITMRVEDPKWPFRTAFPVTEPLATTHIHHFAQRADGRTAACKFRLGARKAEEIPAPATWFISRGPRRVDPRGGIALSPLWTAMRRPPNREKPASFLQGRKKSGRRMHEGVYTGASQRCLRARARARKVDRDRENEDEFGKM